MDLPISLLESERRWRLLLQRRTAVLALQPLQNQAETSEVKDKNQKANEEEDPFDCSSLAIPPIQELVNGVLDNFAEQWQLLDERKIVAPLSQPTTTDGAEKAADGTATNTTNNTSDENEERPNLPKGGRTSLARLPDFFDYATRRSEPPPEGVDCVVSLVDPTVHLSYEQELWKLFQSAPTVDEIENDAVQGVRLEKTRRLHAELTDMMCQQQPQVSLQQYAPVVCRLRMNDRHEHPPPPPQEQNVVSANTASTTSTIRFECLRRQLRLGSSPDTYRMVLECRGSQTLLDLHKAIVELTEDGLWKSVVTTTNTTHSIDGPVTSGCFFIEDAFYTVGSVDYVTPIQTWLNAGQQHDAASKSNHLPPPRKAFLGISSSLPIIPVKSMTNTMLEQIPWRLGVRYHHVFHGDVECALFVVDKSLDMGSASNTDFSFKYPLVHDIWSPSGFTVDCEACQRFPGAVVTSPECTISQGHRTLCYACSQELFPGSRDDLFYDSRTTNKRKRKAISSDASPAALQEYSVWRNQPDLSAGASADTMF